MRTTSFKLNNTQAVSICSFCLSFLQTYFTQYSESSVLPSTQPYLVKKNDVFKPENLLLQQNLVEIGAPPSFLAVYPLLGDGL